MSSVLLEKTKDVSRSIGFPKSDRSETTGSPIINRHPQPDKPDPVNPGNKRRKGRWFVTFVIASIMGFVVISMWNEFFRFQAYGQLEGTIVRLSSPATGNVLAIHVAEGELVEQGQLLVEMDVPELEFQRQQVHRQLQLAVSDLQVRLAELVSSDRQLRIEDIDRQVRYYQLLGQYHQSKSALENQLSRFETNKKLSTENAIAKSEFIETRTTFEGQKSQLDDLTEALKCLEEATVQLLDTIPVEDLMQTERSRIATFQSELKAIDSLQYAKQIRAPVAGRILKRMAEPGEHLQVNQPILELVESGSVEAVVYMPHP